MWRALSVVMLSYAFVEAAGGAVQSEDYEHLTQRARADYRAGRFAAAEPVLLEALRVIPHDNPGPRGDTLVELGYVYVNKDELAKAERVYIEALDIFKRLANSAKTARVLRDLGTIYSLQRRDDEALRILDKALKLSTSGPGKNDALAAQVLNSFGVVYYRQRKAAKAEKAFLQAWQMVSSSPPAGFDIAELLNNLGALYHVKLEFRKAEDFLKRAVKVTETDYGATHPELSYSLAMLGVLYADTGRFRESEDQYRRALMILEARRAEFETRIARLLHGLSMMYTMSGRKEDADATLAEAASIARRKIDTHTDMATILEHYSSVLKKKGKTQEAEELRVEARRARVTAGLVIHALSPF
jgi:tetratricopeptide (TPR) repeat protein